MSELAGRGAVSEPSKAKGIEAWSFYALST
jgi:hypothetical protein